MTVSDLHVLNRADGSCKYASCGFEVLVAVSGPLEAQRRDELPEECFIDVTLRPHAGVSQIKERHIEKTIHDLLKAVIRTQDWPRQTVQVTLQVLQVPQHKDGRDVGGMGKQWGSYLPILPTLLNAACLALLDAAVPMHFTFSSTLLAVLADTTIIADPSISNLESARSMHVFAFGSQGDLLLSESQGAFTIDEWDRIEGVARGKCVEALQGRDVEGVLQQKLRATISNRVTADERWKT